MKVWLILLICTFPISAVAVPNTPTSLKLTADTATITATWVASSGSGIDYKIYKGESENNLIFVGSTTNTSFTISNLLTNTTYYIGVAASDSTGDSSQSISSISTTANDTTAPESPTGFSVSSTYQVTTSSIPLVWDLNSEDDISHYEIRYGTSSGNYGNSIQTSNENISALTISELSASTRYYFTIIAVDENDNESNKSDELIVDTLEDTLAPFTPRISSVELSDVGELTVNFNDAANQGMVDLKGYKMYYGTQNQVYGDPVFIDEGNSTYVISNLNDDTTYYLAISAVDDSNNESSLSAESAVKIEGTVLLLNNDNLFEGGCFITNTVPARSEDRKSSPKSCSRIIACLLCALALLIFRKKWIGYVQLAIVFLLVLSGSANAFDQTAPKNNVLGATFGYTIPSDKLHRDIYEDNQAFKVFYKRRFLKYLALDVTTGYNRKDGNAVTVSGKETMIESELTIIPSSAALTFNYPFTSHIIGYIGGGLDYWYAKEKSEAYHEKTEEGVGGYHGKLGLMLLTKDRNFDGFGVVLETSYSSIDRFEENRLDLGGWNFDFGVVYMF